MFIKMGCGFSSSNSAVVRDTTALDEFHGNVNRSQFGRVAARPTETLIEAFTRLDNEILAIESLSPGSRLTTAEAWIEHLESVQLKVDEVMEDKNSSLNVDVISEIDELILDSEPTSQLSLKHIQTSQSSLELDRERSDIIKLAVKLQVAHDVKKASNQEEFLAKISRGLMELETERLKKDMIEHGKKRVETLIDSFNKLRENYLEQDSLIASISGGTYNSTLEQEIDIELEAAREIRDRLSGVAEQWRTSGNLLRASTKGSAQGCEYWSLIGITNSPEDRVQLALDTRTAILSAITAVDCAQEALPHVEIPFITHRQSSAVRHALIYMLTDMADENRYHHTKSVLESFQTNTNKALDWVQVTYKKTLDEDLSSQIDNIKALTFRLRKERIKHFKAIVGNRIYVKPMIKMPQS